MPTDMRVLIEEAGEKLLQIRDELDRTFTEWAHMKADIDTENAALRRQCESSEATISELRGALADRTKNADDSDASAAELRALLTEAQSRIEEYESNLREASEQRVAGERAADESRSEAKKLTQRVKLAEDARDHLADSLARAIADKESTASELKETKRDRATTVAALSQAESTIESLRGELADEEEKSSHLMQMLANSERERETLLNETIPGLRAEWKKEADKLAPLVEALSWYADPRNNDRLEMEGGRKARAALGIPEGRPVEV
jgi:chromosome segregation ATPase